MWGGGNVPDTDFPTSPKALESLRGLKNQVALSFFYDNFIPGIKGNSFLQRNSEHTLKAEKTFTSFFYLCSLVIGLWLTLMLFDQIGHLDNLLF